MVVPRVEIGIIGGSGLYKLEGFEFVEEIKELTTPWGTPSSSITVAKTPNKTLVAFLARHGTGHTISPSEVPSRANIAALKHIGCNVILAFSAVGSLKEEIRPRDFVLPSQIIDRTRGFRPDSFYEGGYVGHIMFADPFDLQLGEIIARGASALKGDGVRMHTKSTREQVLVCMEGPAFSTRAESRLYRSWDGAVINMSALPEAKLAMEAEIQYAMICMATDYDCWKDDGEAVTVEKVMSNLHANSENAKHLMVKVLEELEVEVRAGRVGKALLGSRKYALATQSHSIKPDVAKKLEFLWGAE